MGEMRGFGALRGVGPLVQDDAQNDPQAPNDAQLGPNGLRPAEPPICR